MVNNYSNSMGVSYVTTSVQRYPYYPMFPGKRGVTSVTFGNYEISDIERDEDTGKITFDIRNTKMSGIDDVTAATLKATGLTNAPSNQRRSRFIGLHRSRRIGLSRQQPTH